MNLINTTMTCGLRKAIQSRILHKNSSLFTLYLITFISFYEPEYISACFPVLSLILSAIKVVVFILLMLLSVVLALEGKRGGTALLWWIMLLHVYLVIMTIVHDGRIIDSLKVCASVGAIYLVIRLAAQTETMPMFIRVGRAFFFIVALINLASVIAFPGGLYYEFDAGLSEHLNAQSAAANAARYFCGHKNSMLTALFPGVICSGVLALESKNRKDFYCALTYVIVLIVSTAFVDAVTSAAIGLLLLLAVIVAHRSPNLRIHFTTVGAALLLADIAIVHLRALDLFAKLLRSFNRNTTLSGRTYIWDSAIHAIQKNWLLGYGIQSPEVLKATFIGFSHPHNLFISILYYGGIVGLLLFGMCLFSSFRNIKLAGRCGAFIFYSTAALMLMGVVESLGVGLSQLVFPISIAYCFVENNMTNKEMTRTRCRDDSE